MVVRPSVSAGKTVLEEQQVLLMAEPPLPSLILTSDFNLAWDSFVNLDHSKTSSFSPNLILDKDIFV